MVTFVVETYLSEHAEDEPDRTIARTIAAIDEMRAAGAEVRYVRSIFIPDDETCLVIIEAAAVELVVAAVERARLDPDRITRAESRDPAPASGTPLA